MICYQIAFGCLRGILESPRIKNENASRARHEVPESVRFTDLIDLDSTSLPPRRV